MAWNKVQRRWAFYDWANSVYSLVISTAIFPIYFNSVSPAQVDFLGAQMPSSALYSYVLAFSFFLVALLSPLLSGIADYTGNKKGFLQFFCYLGATSCGLLFFFVGDNLIYGLGMSVLASIGFWGSIVFYNAFLPEIAPPEKQDQLSALGFSLGYVGSALLLILNLVMVSNPQWFGLADKALASRLSFVSVGLWWAGFGTLSFGRLPRNVFQRQPEEGRIIWQGYRELRQVFGQLKELIDLRRLLYSFFFYSTGVQTIILLASMYGEKELGLDASKLILTILIIQFVGIAGAHFFSWLAGRLGNIRALMVSIAVWTFICFAAYALQGDDPQVEVKFYALGGLVGLVMGGIQSLSRSTYSKMLPPSRSHASFFSFFDVTEKVAIILGTFVFGYLVDITGNMRASALALSVFFLLGLLLIFRVKGSRRAARA